MCNDIPACMSDEACFAMYFASVAGWQFHPGNGSRDFERLTLEMAASTALDMLEVHRKVFPRREV